MARNMPTASNPRRPGRPAQGNNAIGAGGKSANRPGPAYLADAAPVVIGRGTLSTPKGIPARFAGKRLAPDATPTVVNL